MIRTKGGPAAIFTADWHLREDTPICRIDDFWQTQWKKVMFISNLQVKYGCSVFHAGDLFNHWKPSPYLLSKTMQYLPKRFFTIYGQHDLPQHSLDLLHKSGIFTLFNARALNVFGGTHFGQTPTESSIEIGIKKVLIWHRLVWHGRKPWPRCTDPSADDILNRYLPYDVILTGDNHKPFVVRRDKRLLVNPGSLTRQKSDQMNHRPRVYLWYADINDVETVYIPIETNVVNREHVQEKEERDARIDAFISRLNEDWETDIDFVENLNRFERKNQIRRSVMRIIRKAMENERT